MGRLRQIALTVGLAAAYFALPVYAANSGTPSEQENPTEEPAAEASDFYSGFNPQTKQIITQLVTKEGKSLTIVVDQATNTIYLSDSTGATASISIPQLSEAYSHGSAEKYNAFIEGVAKSFLCEAT